jgi:hypothetical protein
MALTVTLAVAQAALTVLLAYLGMHVTLHPPSESQKKSRVFKVGFIACGVLAVGLVGFQGCLTSRSQRDSDNQMSRLRSDVQSAKTESQTARTETEQIRAELQDESARREQAEKDLLIATRGVEINTRKANTQLFSLNALEQQQAEAIRRQMSLIQLQQLADVIYRFRAELDEWQTAERDARAKITGPLGRNDPVYRSQLETLRGLYSNKLGESMRAAKYLYEQIRRSMPEAKIFEQEEDSPLARASAGQQINTDDLRRIIFALNEAYKKASTALQPLPLPEE